MLELADRNKYHFSKKDESGTDNNMGAYNEFHRMALEAAKNKDMETARALEASAMHFLTDRFAGGHQFDKDKVAQAFKDGHAGGNLPGGDLLATGAIRIYHNRGNKDGVDVTNAKGEAWHALGDSRWINQADPSTGVDPNEKNRLRTSQAVYDSFAELQAVADGKKDPAKMKPQDYAAKQDVPVFDPAKQTELEKEARGENRAQLAKDSAKEAGGVLVPTIQRTLINWFGDDGATIVKNWDKAWDWTKESFGEAKSGIGGGLDALKNAAGEAGTGIKNGLSAAGSFAKSTLSEAAGGIRRGAGQVADFVGGGLSDIGSGIKNGVSKAGSWASETLGEAKNGLTGGVSSAWNWFTGTIGGAVQQVKEGGPSSLVDYAKEKASEAGTGVKNGLGKASDFAAQKVGEAAHGLRSAAGQASAYTADKLAEAGTGIRNGAAQASDWAAQKAGEAGAGIRSAAGQARDWTAQKVGEAGQGLQAGAQWAQHKAGEVKQGLQEHGGELWDATQGAVQTTGRAVDKWVHKKADPYVASAQQFVTEQAHSAGTAITNGAHRVEHAASGAVQGTKEAAAAGWTWLKHKAGY